MSRRAKTGRRHTARFVALPLSSQLLHEPAQILVLRKYLSKLLGTLQSRLEIAGIALKIDERQQGIAVAGMSRCILVQRLDSIVNFSE